MGGIDARIESLLSELSFIEMQHQHILDDDSLRLIAEARYSNILTDDDWERTKGFLRNALEFLAGPQETLRLGDDGQFLVDSDFDPRKADWLRIDAAQRLARHKIPMWAALWFWWLRMDTSPEFWRKVGSIAERLGYPKKT
jgi:hypothetical protein